MQLQKYTQGLMVFYLCLFGFTSAFAQKLPNKQITSVRAPSTVQIDGKSTEWGSSLKAYNLATEIFYTMANDDKKLYLVVQSKNLGIMRKIILGGISLVIQKSADRNDNGAAIVKFPYFKEKNRNVVFMLTQSFEDGWHKDPDGRIADSLIKMSNRNLRTNVKWIYTKGVLGKDSVLSMYNEAGIEAMNAFDKTKTYTSELAINLNLLGLSVNNTSKFSYHIMVNDNINKFEPTFTAQRYRGRNSDGTPMSEAQIDAAKLSVPALNGSGAALTDFWGEYTLVK
nr:hypothetical protein [uncultured Mucilaginibacter sp.]